MKTVRPYAGMVIKESVKFEAGVYNFYKKSGFTVAASNIVIDASDSYFVNGCEKEESTVNNVDEFQYGDNNENISTLGYFGIAIKSAETSNVVLRNFSAKGFVLGLRIEKCSGWTIENCDFSYNYTNMDWGWDEHPIRGGMLLESCENCLIQNNTASNVWDALVLRHSNNNTVKNNNLSHTSDTGLKLWSSSNNEIIDNDCSWGLRKNPGEVHARDSAGVLVECGSNDNYFKNNDMRFGGDGLFIRVLNGWMSTGNVFEGNDTSYANNNAIEAWSDGNTYINNRANHSSYGFWLGNSDNTTLIGNEVAYNGISFSNAPESFGNCGIAVVNGSGSNFVVRDNYIHDNYGCGMAIRNSYHYPSMNWIIENNRFHNNKTFKNFTGHGIFLHHAKDIVLINNDFNKNDGQDVHIYDHAANIRHLEGGQNDAPACKILYDKVEYVVGKEYCFDSKIQCSNKEDINCFWAIGDKTESNNKKVYHTFSEVGMHRIYLQVDDGKRAGFDSVLIYVTPDTKVLCNDMSKWSLNSDGDGKIFEGDYSITGNKSLGMIASCGIRHQVTYDLHSMKIDSKENLTYALKFFGESTDWDNTNKRPEISLVDKGEKKLLLKPNDAILRMYSLPINEYKNNWIYFDIPFAGNKDWEVVIENGFDYNSIKKIVFDIGPNESSYCEYYIDAVKIYTPNDSKECNLTIKHEQSEYPKVVCSEGKNSYAPLFKKTFFGDCTPRYMSNESVVYYEVDFGTKRYIDQVEIVFNESKFNSKDSIKEALPKSIKLYGLEGEYTLLYDALVSDKQLVIPIKLGLYEKIKLEIVKDDGCVSLVDVKVFNTVQKSVEADKIEQSNKTLLDIEAISIRVNKEINESGTELSTLYASINEFEEQRHRYRLLDEECIAKNSIKSNKEYKVNLSAKDLDSQKEYFVKLYSDTIAESPSVGDYYRWIGSGFSKDDKSHGFIKDGKFQNDKVGWGRNWLKVYTNRGVFDFSHRNENMGNRISIKDFPERFQKFEFDNLTDKVFIPTMDQNMGWLVDANKSENIKIALKEKVDANLINLYFKSTGGKGCLKIDNKEYDFKVCRLVSFEIDGAKEIEITLQTQNELILNQIEFM